MPVTHPERNRFGHRDFQAARMDLHVRDKARSTAGSRLPGSLHAPTIRAKTSGGAVDKYQSEYEWWGASRGSSAVAGTEKPPRVWVCTSTRPPRAAARASSAKGDSATGGDAATGLPGMVG